MGKNDNRKILFSILHLSKAGWLAATEYFEVHGKGQEGRRKGVSKGGKKGAKAPVVRARKTSGRLPATGSVVSVSDLATKTLPELKSLCKTEGLNGGELEWQLRNTLMLHFGYGPLPLPTYTLSDLRAMTVVELRSACVIVGLPDGGVKKDVLDRLVAHFGHSPAGVDGGSGAGVVVGAGVPGAGVMTLQDLVANGIMHKELESHVSGCLDREGGRGRDLYSGNIPVGRDVLQPQG